MNNDEIYPCRCAPSKGDAPVSFDDSSSLPIKRTLLLPPSSGVRRGGLNLDRVNFSLLRALDKLHSAVLFESSCVIFTKVMKAEGGGTLFRYFQRAADLNNKSSRRSRRVNYSAALENSICW